MQNLLAFRFSNGIFEPLWNKQPHRPHPVQRLRDGRRRGPRRLLRQARRAARHDPEPHVPDARLPVHGAAGARSRPTPIRNEKAKLLEAVRVYTPEEVLQQHRPRPVRPRQEGPTARRARLPRRRRRQPDVRAPRPSPPLKLLIDNWRWEGVPIYLRSGKALWKRGTEIVVQFKKAPEVHVPRHAGVDQRRANRLIFHIQPDQGIELRFQAKSPGPSMLLQKVNMRFDYQRGVRGVARHRLRGDALHLHARRRDAVLAHRPGRGGVADRAADPRRLGSQPADATSRTTRPARGARRRRST